MNKKHGIMVIASGCLVAVFMLAGCVSGSGPRSVIAARQSGSSSAEKNGLTVLSFTSSRTAKLPHAFSATMKRTNRAGNSIVLSPAPKSRSPFILVQSTGPTAQTTTNPPADAISSATSAEETTASDATSAASETPTAESCLSCHGPFEKLANRTAGYVTDWDEKANPHVYVPHDSKTIVACTDCHEAHAIPVTSTESIPKATVQYCYSCHHAETLVNCNTCHKE